MRDELTRLDAIAGDGDCGDTLAAGAAAILEDSVDYIYKHPDVVCDQLANSCARSMGGTSGVLYDVFFRAAGDFWVQRKTFDVLCVARIQSRQLSGQYVALCKNALAGSQNATVGNVAAV